MNIEFWTRASPRRKRILSTLAIFVAALLITVLGMLIPISNQDANKISNDLNATVNSLKATNSLPSYIFGNNFVICLMMFIPIAGPIFGFYVLFNTGTALSAVAISQGYPPLLALLAEFLTPVFWLEFAAYSIAIAESIWLLRRILQKPTIHEFKNAGILVTICAVILFVSAYIETAIISLA